MTNTNQLTPLTPNDSTSRLISWTQRVVLLDILDQEAARLLQHAAALDAKLSEEADALEIADDVPDYDQRCEAADLAHDRAAAVDDLLQVLEGARPPHHAPRRRPRPDHHDRQRPCRRARRGTRRR